MNVREGSEMWANGLPQELLEFCFGFVVDPKSTSSSNTGLIKLSYEACVKHKEDIFRIRAVCKNWRQIIEKLVGLSWVSFRVSTQAKWPLPVFPFQLCLPVGQESEALKCYVHRERSSHGLILRMYIGKPEDEIHRIRYHVPTVLERVRSSCWFALSALKVPRFGKSPYWIISTNKDIRGTPSAEETIAVLHAYRSGTRFRLNVRDSCRTGESVTSENWGVNALTVAYRTKFMGIKTSGPRQLAVEFKSLIFQANNSYRNEQLLKHYYYTSPGDVPEHRASQPAKSKGKAVHPMQPQEPSSPLSYKVFRLHNRPPQWNSVLKCWCLDFDGRVTRPSVKNIQLVTNIQQLCDASGEKIDTSSVGASGCLSKNEDDTDDQNCRRDAQGNTRSQQMEWPELPPSEYYSRGAITNDDDFLDPVNSLLDYDNEGPQESMSASEPNGSSQKNSSAASGKVSQIIQFGRVAEDMFTLDFCNPLSMVQAFSISLTTMDRKNSLPLL